MTWKDLLPIIDAAIAELAQLMNDDPRHGVLFQQRMAVMTYRKQQVQGILGANRDTSFLAEKAIEEKVSCLEVRTSTAR